MPRAYGEDSGGPAGQARQKIFVEADLRIVTGLVEPHFMAGYSGGRKVIVPGIAHQETIRALHSARQLVRAGVANCVLDGNPFHEEQIQAARLAGKCSPSIRS